MSKFAIASTILASAVADSGTFTIGYPSGTSQLSFNAGLAGSGHYAILNSNDKYAAIDADMSVSFGASDITITNSSGASWPAGSEVMVFLDQVDGNDVVYLNLPIKLAKLANGDVVTEFRPGVAGAIEDVQFIVTDPATTAAKAATLNLEIGTTNLTGGTVALTSANCTPLGAVVAGAAITAGNVLARESKLSVEASSVTAFAEGEGVLVIRIRKSA